MSRSWRSLLLLVLVASLIAPQAVAAGGGTTPSCSNDSLSLNEDQTANGQLTCSDVDPTMADYEVVNDVSDGTLNLDHSDGSFLYTPLANFNGGDSFDFTVTDGDGTSTQKTISITVDPVNDAPVAINHSYPTPEDTALVVSSGSGLRTGATDADGDTLSVSLIAPSAAHGTVSPLNSNGAFTYTPDANFHGSDTFGFRVSDGNGGHDDATATITITPVNDAPVCNNGTSSTNEDTPVTDNVDCSDVDGDSLAYSVTGAPTHGSVHFNGGTESFTYTPTAGYHGSDSFGFTADDGDLTDSGTQTVTIASVNDPPVATGDAQSTLEDTTLVVPTPGVLANDSDPDGDILSAVLVADVTHGTLSLSSNGRFTYTPDADYNGSDSFTYKAKDPSNAVSSTVTVTLTVTPVNDPPTFTKGGNQTVVEDSGAHSLPNWATNVSPGPSDESSQNVVFVRNSDSNAALFTVEPAVSPTGTLTYTTYPNANGVANVVLDLVDDGGTLNGGDDTSSTVTFKITVSPVNDPPICADDSTATFVDSALNAALTTCTDIDADTLTYSLVGASIHGTTVVHADGTYTYTPNAAFQGTDTFTFSVNDGTVASNTSTMSILVAPDPIARNDVAPTDFPAIVQGSGPTAIPVLANDLDKQMGPLLIQSVTQGAKGKVTITGGGTGLTYDPTGLLSGTDSFRYTIVDEQLRTNSAIVVVSIVKDTVKPVATVPAMLVISPSTLGSTTVKVRITWSASDVGSGVKTYLLQESAHGGPFRTVALAGPLSRSAVRNVIVGKGYRYRVRATDAVGNVGFLVISPVLTPARVQEASTAITYAGGWGVASSSTYSGAKARWSKSAGASATYTFSGRGIAWVSARSLARGGARVYIDGVLIRSVSLRATRTTARQVVFATRFGVVGPHTIRIVVIGTAGHPRVDLDAFVVTR